MERRRFGTSSGACGAARQSAFKGQAVGLGAVTITVADLNRCGLSTSDDDALSLVLKLTYWSFDRVFPGDLKGTSRDVESIVGPEVGDVDVCKISHHGSNAVSSEGFSVANDSE